MPKVYIFGPMGIDYTENVKECIIMTVEEYETIRLMDVECLNQEEAAEIMDVARSTFQRIYDIARKKIAESLIYGKVLKIEGGDYKICDEVDSISGCNGRGCRHRRRGN